MPEAQNQSHDLVVILSESSDFADFTKRLVSQRRQESHRLSQRQLSHRLGYNASSLLSDVAAGKRKPNLKLFNNLCDYFSIDGLRKHYLFNLFSLAHSTDSAKCRSLHEENQLIKTYWKSVELKNEGFNPLDVIVLTYIADRTLRQKVTVGDVALDLSPYLSQLTLLSVLSSLADRKLIRLTSDGITMDQAEISNKKQKMELEAYIKLLPILETVFRRGNKATVQTFCLSAWLTDEQYKDAKQALFLAYEKIALLSLKNQGQQETQKKNLYTFFECATPLTQGET
ncbi:MAG: helix-turn-helix transcriptional regulator [Pseudomonadota bacterium]